MDGYEGSLLALVCGYSLCFDHCPVIQGLFPFGELETRHIFRLGNTNGYLKIVATLGFHDNATYLIQAPPPIIAFLVTLAISWSSGRRLEHGYHIIVPILFTLVGCAVMITTLNVGARYFSMVLLVVGPFVGLNVSIDRNTSWQNLLTDYRDIDSNLLGDDRRSTSPH